MDFEQLLLQQVYKKNVDISGLLNQIEVLKEELKDSKEAYDDLLKENEQLETKLDAQYSCNKEQKKKIEELNERLR